MTDCPIHASKSNLRGAGWTEISKWNLVKQIFICFLANHWANRTLKNVSMGFYTNMWSFNIRKAMFLFIPVTVQNYCIDFCSRSNLISYTLWYNRLCCKTWKTCFLEIKHAADSIQTVILPHPKVFISFVVQLSWMNFVWLYVWNNLRNSYQNVSHSATQTHARGESRHLHLAGYQNLLSRGGFVMSDER